MVKSQRLRGALIGCGFIAESGHLPVYERRAKDSGQFEIRAVADVCPQRRERARALLPGVSVYDDYRELLRDQRGSIDFVDVATPPSLHAQIVHDALDCRLHVLCEKPIAVSVQEARAMTSHARLVSRVFFPCHNYKHAPVIRNVRQILNKKILGDVRLVTLQTFRTRHAQGVAEWNPDWRRQRQFSGGGIAMDHGSHTFYLAFEWFGCYPKTITARSSTLERYDTEDNFHCTLTFPTGLATAQLSWTAGVRKVIYTIHGEHGAILVDDDRLELHTPFAPLASHSPEIRDIVKASNIPSHWGDASHTTWFDGLLDEFLLAIETDDFAGHEATDAIVCVSTIMAGYESALRKGREVQIPEAPVNGSATAHAPSFESSPVTSTEAARRRLS